MEILKVGQSIFVVSCSLVEVEEWKKGVIAGIQHNFHLYFFVRRAIDEQYIFVLPWKINLYSILEWVRDDKWSSRRNENAENFSNYPGRQTQKRTNL
jgi:hypothetical protein